MLDTNADVHFVQKFKKYDKIPTVENMKLSTSEMPKNAVIRKVVHIIHKELTNLV